MWAFKTNLPYLDKAYDLNGLIKSNHVMLYLCCIYLINNKIVELTYTQVTHDECFLTYWSVEMDVNITNIKITRKTETRQTVYEIDDGVSHSHQ